MNKRIFTLIAGLLLTFGIGLGAQTTPPSYAMSAIGDTALVIEDGKYYQLGNVSADGDSTVLAMEFDDDSKEYYVVMKNATTLPLPNTLWQVSVSNNGEAGISFVFTNKKTGLALGFDEGKTTTIGDTASIHTKSGTPIIGSNPWKWHASVNPVGGFTADSLISAFSNGLSAMVLMTNNKGAVFAVKYNLNAKPDFPNIGNLVRVLPIKPAPVLLGVDDLNSMLWENEPTATSKVKFSFDKDVEGSSIDNLFTKNEYRAVPAIGFPASLATAPQKTLTPLVTRADVLDVDSFYVTLATDTTLADRDAAERLYVEARAQETFAKAIQAIVAGTNFTEKNLEDARAAIQAISRALRDSTCSTRDSAKMALANVDSAGVNSLPAIKAALSNYIDQTSSLDTIFKRAAADTTATTTTAAGSAAMPLLSRSGVIQVSIAWDLLTCTTENALTLAVNTYTKEVKNTKEALEDAYAEAKEYFDKLAASDTVKWLSLEYSKGKHLMVDTAFVTESAGDKHLTFAIKEFKDVGFGENYNNVDSVARLDLNGRFNFQFQYFPSSDSIVIRTGGFAKKQDNTPLWLEMDTDKNPLDLGLAKARITPSYTELDNGSMQPVERNIVKIAVLANKHREVTVGNSEYKAGSDPRTTINTRIHIGGKVEQRTTLDDGLYFITLQTSDPKRKAEHKGYKIVHLSAAGTQVNGAAGTLYAREDDAELFGGDIQNFAYVPATQWVVEKTEIGNKGMEFVNIYNREYPHICMTNVQLYSDGNSNFRFQNLRPDAPFAAADTLCFTTVESVKTSAEEKAAIYGDPNNGYFYLADNMLNEQTYSLEYLSGIGLGHFIDVSSNASDSILRVRSAGQVYFMLEKAPKAAKSTYGYTGKLTKGNDKLFSALERTAYFVRVKDANKLKNDSKYVVKVETSSIGEPVYGVSSSLKPAIFFFKENNRLPESTVTKSDVETSPFFAIVDAVPVVANNDTTGWAEDCSANAVRMGVKDGSLYITQEKKGEKRVAAFRLYRDNTPLYRRLGHSDPNDELKDNDTNIAKIYTINSAEREYLYEDAHSKYSVDANGNSLGINFLGLEDKGINAQSALFIDTAYVRNNTSMPQYMIAVGVKIAEPGEYCPENPEHNTEEYLNTHGDCGHRVWMDGYVDGRYLINAKDSVVTSARKNDYIWNTKYTRLAFVQARHIGDTLIIFRDGKPSTASEDSIFLGDNLHNQLSNSSNDVHRIHRAHKNGIKNPVFAFRLIDEKAVCDFLIESEGDQKIPTAARSGWVKIQNGVPVIANYAGGYNEAITDSEIFNIEMTTDEPVSNDAISTEGEVEVIAGEGDVTVKNASGETVVISNILGQNMVTRKLTSDSETIEVPAGIVVVSVGNSTAVKAIVR